MAAKLSNCLPANSCPLLLTVPPARDAGKRVSGSTASRPPKKRSAMEYRLEMPSLAMMAFSTGREWQMPMNTPRMVH